MTREWTPVEGFNFQEILFETYNGIAQSPSLS